MIFIVGLILFWLSCLGYFIYLKKKTKLPGELVLPLVFTLIGIIMFIAGILNMMREFSVILCFLGIVLFGYYLYKKEIEWKMALSVNFIILLFVFLYITLICGDMRLLHYDNFSHWGLIVKNMFLSDGLPNFENAVIEFRNYQPGSACFIYYFGFLTGKTEGMMIIAQNYLLIAYFFSLLVFTNGKKGGVLKVLLVVFYVFVLLGNIEFYNLLVDTLIAGIAVCSLVIFYYFRDDLKKAFIYTLPLCVYLFLVKNTGIVLVGINCLLLLLLGWRNKELKKSFLYAVITGVITVAFFYIWSRHVAMSFGELGLASKHSLSASNILLELRTKGWDGIFDFCGIYLKHFIDVFNNIPNKYMIAINLFLVLLVLIYKNYRKELVKCLILVDVIYLLYYGVLGVMYLLSMPWEEASYLAGFDRYMLTIVFVVIGGVLIKLFNVVGDDKKSGFLVVGVLVLALVYNCKHVIYDYKLLLGEQNYEDTSAYYFDQILGSNMYDADSDEFYYVYAPVTSAGDSGYLKYLAKFKLNTEKVMVITNVLDISDENKYNINIIVFDKDEDIMEFLEDNDYEKENNMYVKA